jgi:hypothetical protein
MRQSAELLAAIDKAGRVDAVKAEERVRAKGCFGGFEWFLARHATVKRPFQTRWGSYRSAVYNVRRLPATGRKGGPESKLSFLDSP